MKPHKMQMLWPSTALRVLTPAEKWMSGPILLSGSITQMAELTDIGDLGSRHREYPTRSYAVLTNRCPVYYLSSVESRNQPSLKSAHSPSTNSHLQTTLSLPPSFSPAKQLYTRSTSGIWPRRTMTGSHSVFSLPQTINPSSAAATISTRRTTP